MDVIQGHMEVVLDAFNGLFAMIPVAAGADGGIYIADTLADRNILEKQNKQKVFPLHLIWQALEVYTETYR